MTHQTVTGASCAVREHVARLERRLRVLQAAYVVGLLAVTGYACAGLPARNASSAQTADVLRVRGLIVEDAQGRPRILLGAPVQPVAGRTRRDTTTAMIVVGPNGADRVIVGYEPDPMVEGKIYPRRVGGVGVLIHDPDGTEQGGYSAKDDGKAVLTLAWRTGEGFTAVVDDKQGFAGVGIWHRSPLGKHREAATLGVIDASGETFLKLTDSTGAQRARVQVRATAAPEFLLYGPQGQVTRNALGSDNK